MNTRRPSACFAGIRLEALQVLQRYTQVTSIITLPDSWVHRYCASNEIPVELIEKRSRDKAFHFLANQSASLVVSAGFPYILPRFVLASGPTFINSHPSLLPAYKGIFAIKEAVDNHEEFMGVTVHYMIEDVDAGPVIHQERVWVKGLMLQEIY